MDNTEGSRAISQIFSVRKNLRLHATDHQMAVILGSILGDAYVYPQGKICFEQADFQKEYLFWKYAQLDNLAYPKVSQVIRTDKRTDTQTISWRFFLRQYFRPLRNAFYHESTKKIPSDLQNWMTSELLAVWYMDDGHLDRGKYPELMTESFSQKDVQLLAKMLKNAFDLDCLVTSKRRIRIPSNHSRRFFFLIEPWIHPNLRYKLP
jgi:hypothetical protein